MGKTGEKYLKSIKIEVFIKKKKIIQYLFILLSVTLSA